MGFVKHAQFAVLEAEVARPGIGLMRTAHRHTFNYVPRQGFLYVRSRAISSRTNDNFDTFPADEIAAAWHTFIGKPVFVNHHNDNHKRARGVIIDAVLHEDVMPDGTPDTWVEVLQEVDAVRFPKLAQAIINRDIERTSMGCDVQHSECSVCGNIATTPSTYCAHVSRMKGQRIRRRHAATGKPEDVLVHEICRGLSFFENSLLVEPPADPTAHFLGVDTRGVTGMALTASRKTAKGPRFDGVGLRQDDDGWYVATHRCRSDSYPSAEEIPDSVIQFIESTGSSRTAGQREYEMGYADGGSDFLNGRHPAHRNGDEFVERDYDKGYAAGYAAAAHNDEAGRDPGPFTPSLDWWSINMPIAASRKTAFGETTVPPKIDTLRVSECPVCGEEASNDGDGRCRTCGYLPPPEPFREPDLGVAQRTDLHDGGWFSPDLMSAPPFQPPEDQSASSTVPPTTSPTK